MNAMFPTPVIPVHQPLTDSPVDTIERHLMDILVDLVESVQLQARDIRWLQGEVRELRAWQDSRACAAAAGPLAAGGDDGRQPALPFTTWRDTAGPTVEQITRELLPSPAAAARGSAERRFLCPTCGQIPLQRVRQVERDETCIYTCRLCDSEVQPL